MYHRYAPDNRMMGGLPLAAFTKAYHEGRDAANAMIAVVTTADGPESDMPKVASLDNLTPRDLAYAKGWNDAVRYHNAAIHLATHGSPPLPKHI